MGRKRRLLFKTMKKSLVKVSHIRHSNFYNGRNFIETVKIATSYPFKHGTSATIAKFKKEIVRVGSGGLNKHHFPNGLISGVDMNTIYRYENSKPVSIVIPSYNDYDLLKKCIESVHRTCSGMNYEVIIVDDYCEDSNRIKLQSLSNEKTRIIFREKNGGFAKAVNTGFREVPASNDIVMLNSDIEAHSGWLKALQYGAYEFGENIGIVGPKLLYPDGRIQSAGSFRNTESPEWFDHYYRFQDSNYGPANVPQYCIAITGACQYIKRDFIDEVGILDENFPFAFEEVDLCLRGWEKDFKTLYFPGSTLTHHEGVTRSKNKTISEKEKKSLQYFWEKWGKWFDERNVKNETGQTRIIFVLQSWGFSGGIKNVIEHANRLAKEGFDTEVWSLDFHNPAWPINTKTRSFKNYSKLRKELEKEEAIKVATWWETINPVWLASLKKGIAVNMIQEIESWFYPDDLEAQRTVISCYRKEFKNMTISTYNKDELGSLGLSATLIPCGYEDNIYKPLGIEKKGNNLLAVGRTFFQKNFIFTFKAWKSLGQLRPGMILFGSEPDMKSWDERIEYITKPSDEEVNELYNKATMFVQTSKHEGFCLPVLEAMAAGSPVICTDMHGNRDFSKNGKTCIMVAQDNEKELAEAITRLQNDKKLQRQLSMNGIKEAKKYTWSVVTKQLVDFYNNVEKQDPIINKVRNLK